ncbi:MAG TPA: hypothetical protein VNB94_05765 [Mycobacteriales bacterium]|nr:hypothetical protein [Mycobacteriales bacterium]
MSASRVDDTSLRWSSWTTKITPASADPTDDAAIPSTSCTTASEFQRERVPDLFGGACKVANLELRDGDVVELRFGGASTSKG